MIIYPQFNLKIRYLICTLFFISNTILLLLLLWLLKCLILLINSLIITNWGRWYSMMIYWIILVKCKSFILIWFIYLLNLANFKIFFIIFRKYLYILSQTICFSFFTFSFLILWSLIFITPLSKFTAYRPSCNLLLWCADSFTTAN
jgi:hypothetical protein